METGSDVQTIKGEGEVTDKIKLSAITDVIKRPFMRHDEYNFPKAVWDDGDEYDFSHASRGTAIIFNMNRVKNGKGEIKDREGSSIDADRLSKTFKLLGFQVQVKEDQTRKQMIKLLKEESKRDHSNADCFVCVLLTHGDSCYDTYDGFHKREDVILAFDQLVYTSELIRLFQDSECKTLRGKPKLFFVQACRGGEFDYGVHMKVGKDEVDARPENSIEFNPCPIYKDFLIMYATPPGFYAFRHPENGSWFVQGLCKVLSSPGIRNKTLLQLLTAVIKVVSLECEATAKEYLGNKQSPCFISMLVKDVYFRPKTKCNPL